jgi:plasmid replication initiation protein
MRDETAHLAKALEPSFTAPEDAERAATMMVMALRYELGQPATEADQLRYRTALERLPTGSTATGRVVFVSPYDQKTDPHWRVTFTVGPLRYESSRRFGSMAEAENFVSDFLARLRGEINRP